MKRLKKILKELWMERRGLLQILAYTLVIGWFGYVLRFILKSNLAIMPKILLFIGGCVLAFLNCIGLCSAFSEDDE
jgi:hypothetical protein